MKDLIIYYSWTGHTKTVASTIAEELKGELVGLKEEKDRKKGLGYVSAAFQALFGLKSKIKEPNLKISDYQRIFIGTPIWAGKATPAVNTILSKCKLENKKIFLFFTLQDNKPPLQAVKILTKNVKQQGGQVYNTMSVRTRMGEELKKEKVKTKVREWLQKIGE